MGIEIIESSLSVKDDDSVHQLTKKKELNWKPAPLFGSPSDIVLDDLVYFSKQQFTYEDLKMFTDDFSDDNFIVRTQFCKVYRGKVPKAWNNLKGEEEERVVTVKIWADSLDFPGYPDRRRIVNFAGNFLRCKDEVELLSNEDLSTHPNLVKLMGWCCEIESENLGLVYDLNSYDTLRNLIPREVLNWADRIRIALGLASLLKTLHSYQPRCLVLNISAAHIMIDQDLKPVLLEFGYLFTGDNSNGTYHFPSGAYGYRDPLVEELGWGEWADVFGFGAVLMELLRKGTGDDECKDFNYFSAEPLYESLIKTKWKVPCGMLVEKSLMQDAEFNHHDGDLLTILAIRCLIRHYTYLLRPTMPDIISQLKSLYFFGGITNSDQLTNSDQSTQVDSSIIRKMKKMLLRAFR